MAVLQQSPYLHGGLGVGMQPVMVGSEITAGSGGSEAIGGGADSAPGSATYTWDQLYGPQNPYLEAGARPGSVQDPHSKTWYAPGHPDYERVKAFAESVKSGSVASQLANQAKTGADTYRARSFQGLKAAAAAATPMTGIFQLQQPDEQEERDVPGYLLSSASPQRQGIGQRTRSQASSALQGLRGVY